MSVINCENLVTPSVIRTVFEDFLVDPNNKGWIITVCGKILTVNGKMFWPSRTQAVKAFYNSYHWKAMREMHIEAHPESDRWGWWSDENRTVYWRSFKKVLERDYGLNFVRV